MSINKLVSTVKFVTTSGDSVKYEIYQDTKSSDYHAEIYHLDQVSSDSGLTLTVWHKIPQTIYRLSGNAIEDLENFCENHFKGK